MAVELYDYQQEAVDSGKPFIFGAPGFGKTLTSLTKLKPLVDGGRIHNILVITTKSQVDISIKHGYDWVEDYEKVFDKKPKAVQFKTDKHLVHHADYDLIMITHHFGEMKKMVEAGIDLSRTAVIVDECHKVKNPGVIKNTRKGKEIKNGKAGYYTAQLVKKAYTFVGLTGSPSSVGWFDYANYFIMSKMVNDVDEFNALFTIRGDKEVAYGRIVRNEILDYKNVDLLKRGIERIGYRSRETEYYSGVNINEHTIPFKADKKALKQFTRDLKYLPYGEEEPVIAETNAAVLHKSKMIASGMNHEVSAKAKYVYDLLTEEKIGRTILFYNFNDEYDNIVRTIDKYNKLLKKNVTYKTINGKVKELDFRDDMVDVLLINYGSGAEALNIQDYTNTIMFSPTYKYSSHKQANGRNNRVSQKNDITRYYLVNEIEDVIAESLRNKKDYDYTDKATYDKFWDSLK